MTLLIVVMALVLVRMLWLHYMNDPWTRDARVRANVINIAPDVSGLVDKVLVQDNQLVKKGEVLFEVDASHYQLTMQRAVNNVIARKTDVDLRNEEAARRRSANDLVVSRENRNQASSAAKVAEAQYQQALSELASAKLDLQRTKIRATADGYITNLNLHKGDYIQVGQPALALIDKDSFWVYGYFEETKLPLVKEGEIAEITLMSGEKMRGHVSSIARGIYDSDNPDSQELIANVRPTFDWVRLARRIPVHITLDNMPANQILAMGTTCTVVLQTEHPRRWWDIF
ncbi:efflux RND transporter periplasmic adaptor subunit [Shewanella dokdonensis]|uniref:efflux RND transporter periplasmic adaptor subunit n=1 Tax=Shewanella dokdonensis TaxID=712036 RepID=UPI00200BEF0A|nr:efflux RND transporter periplasmic adaptor subunit [Shewanella dokdonensis]MCL1076137.1 efflux RND transporter periplasmic adaptor subunit [Shewanella dokdonensis]